MNKNTRRTKKAEGKGRAMPSKRKSSWQGNPGANRHTQQRPGEAVPRTGVTFKDIIDRANNDPSFR